MTNVIPWQIDSMWYVEEESGYNTKALRYFYSYIYSIYEDSISLCSWTEMLKAIRGHSSLSNVAKQFYTMSTIHTDATPRASMREAATRDETTTYGENKKDLNP